MPILVQLNFLIATEPELRRELPRYCEIVGLPTDGKSFAKDLRDRLSAALDEADANFPANDSIEFVNEELIIHKPGKEPEPPNSKLIDQAITASMPHRQHPGSPHRNRAVARPA